MFPERTKQTIDDYVERGYQPGGFVTAVLENNLVDAVSRADRENLEHLKEICQYVYWNIPADCWGSKAKVKDWLKNKREKVS